MGKSTQILKAIALIATQRTNRCRPTTATPGFFTAAVVGDPIRESPRTTCRPVTVSLISWLATRCCHGETVVYLHVSRYPDNADPGQRHDKRPAVRLDNRPLS
jgi:hypothetical protein